jgi:hypothetical protein
VQTVVVVHEPQSASASDHRVAFRVEEFCDYRGGSRFCETLAHRSNDFQRHAITLLQQLFEMVEEDTAACLLMSL